MEKQILDLVAALVAAMIVMILHELPKTLVYYKMEHDSKKQSLKYALRVQHYIDPIGLIFCVTTHGGFSKPYMYRIKDKKLNRALGITGFLSLVFMFALSVLLLKFGFGVRAQNGTFYYNAYMGQVNVLLMQVCFHLATLSAGMFFVNLFPIATFDMGNMIAGISPTKFFEFLRKDYFMKLLLLFVLIFGIIASLGELIVSFLL